MSLRGANGDPDVSARASSGASERDSAFSPRGLVLDIHRGALHDGPGVRTTVFLKGCPLRCVWCHNPEAWRPYAEVTVNAEACANCERHSACVEACSAGAMSWTGSGPRIDRRKCNTCGSCVDFCERGALSVAGREMDADGVMELVLRDRSFYARSGGGVTLSGGEPMAQPRFACALLRAAHVAGIHTCLDTCGNTSWSWLREAVQWTDLFLFDYKATGSTLHRQLTGVSNGRILSNLDRLYLAGARIQLRCVLVPGVNDSPAHLDAIAEMSRRYPRLQGIRILPYHNFGAHKAARVGRAPFMHPCAGGADVSRWLSELDRIGCIGAGPA